MRFALCLVEKKKLRADDIQKYPSTIIMILNLQIEIDCRAYLSIWGLWTLPYSIFNLFLFISFLCSIVCILHLYAQPNLQLSEYCRSEQYVLCFCVISPHSFPHTHHSWPKTDLPSSECTYCWEFLRILEQATALRNKGGILSGENDVMLSEKYSLQKQNQRKYNIWWI